MRLIDADKLKKKVLMWMPSDPCGIAEKERPIETDIAVSLMMEIEEAPTIEPEPHWIPCSERLPEDTAMPVLISGRHKTVGIYAVDIARYNGGMWQYDGFTFPDCEVLAWMPLPKPYREDGEEE